MFSFFRRGKTAGKPEDSPNAPEHTRTTAQNTPDENTRSGETVKSASTLTRKDVVNLLIPQTDYHTHKTGVSGILHNIMAGKKRARNKNKNKHKTKITRAESYKEINVVPANEMQNVNLFRSHSELDKSCRQNALESLSAPTSACDLTYDDVTEVTEDRNIPANDARESTDAHAQDADSAFVRALVLHKYANKSPVQDKRPHVSLVYVSSEPSEEVSRHIEDKRHAENLLQEIAKSIDCTLDSNAGDQGQMGATDSKTPDNPHRTVRREPDAEHIYAEVSHEKPKEDTSITAFKDDLRCELDKLLQNQNEKVEEEKLEDVSDNVFCNAINEHVEETTLLSPIESPEFIKKSNLKLPKSDTDGFSDDDRSDCGKKKVTFRKTIDFDDGDQQTDDEVDSSFASLASSDEEEEEDSSELPDNDELLGGVVVARNDEKAMQQEDFSIPTIIANNSDPETDATSFDTKTNVRPESPETKVDIDSRNSNKEQSFDDDKFPRLSSDNSDSGFLEISDKQNDSSEEITYSDTKNANTSDSSGSEVTDSDEEHEEDDSSEEEIIARIIEPQDYAVNEMKSLVNQEDKFQTQVAQLTELASARSSEAERVRDQITRFRKDIQAKDQEIEHLKCELAAAYKESEMIRQRSRSLEEDLAAARCCSAELALQLSQREADGVKEQALRDQLEAAKLRSAELETRMLALERDKEHLEQERRMHEQKAQEAVEAAEASSARWRSAHEAARSQAAARAERLLADCEWKMRELERRARDADKQKQELAATLEKTKAEAQKSPAQEAELQQLKGLMAEQQRSMQTLTSQMQRTETREENLKVEVQRLKDLLEKEALAAREKEERHRQAIAALEAKHVQQLDSARAAHAAQYASTRAALERAQAERTRAALAQLRAEGDQNSRNAERKLREAAARYDALKEELATKEENFSKSMAEARSTADWELLQLRHLLDRADINHANAAEQAAERHEQEQESLTSEWSERLRAVEEAAEAAAGEARRTLESAHLRMLADRQEQVNKLKEQHRQEMEEQWEQFMTNKEACLTRMKAECRQEGEEERVKREKELLEEIAELRAQMEARTSDLETMTARTEAVGRTLAVTEEELREALEREKDIRHKHSDDATKIKQLERATRDQVEHLTRKCACLRKLFDDMRTRLSARERTAEQEARAREREVHTLRAEVQRLTRILVEQGSPRLGARTRADGCDSAQPLEQTEQSFFSQAAPPACETQPQPPRRKGGTLRTPELARKRPTMLELKPIPPGLKPVPPTSQPGRPRAKSVDLPAVQVPVRIRQIESRSNK